LKKRQSAFTLIELLVTTVIVAIAVVGALGGIRALTAAQTKAQDAALLQRLADEKLNDLRILQDPTSETTGDFSDRGYTDITWSADDETTATSNLDQITVTATRGNSSQSITTMIYVPPQTTTSTGTGATGGTGAP
jgi:prepilin-type N-terminal cleavage/methylation domain-containing protein